MARTPYEIMRDSLLMAMQDLDEPDLTPEEYKARVSNAKAKASVASAYAKMNKSFVEAERLRLEYNGSQVVDEIAGPDETKAPAGARRLTLGVKEA